MKKTLIFIFFLFSSSLSFADEKICIDQFSNDRLNNGVLSSIEILNRILINDIEDNGHLVAKNNCSSKEKWAEILSGMSDLIWQLKHTETRLLQEEPKLRDIKKERFKDLKFK